MRHTFCDEWKMANGQLVLWLLNWYRPFYFQVIHCPSIGFIRNSNLVTNCSDNTVTMAPFFFFFLFVSVRHHLTIIFTCFMWMVPNKCQKCFIFRLVSSDSLNWKSSMPFLQHIYHLLKVKSEKKCRPHLSNTIPFYGSSLSLVQWFWRHSSLFHRAGSALNR